MRAVLLTLFGFCPLYGQLCPPALVLPIDQVTGSLDNASCRLSDGTVYAAYRLDLPRRGYLRIGLAANADLLLILRNAAGARLDSGTAIGRPVEAGSYTVLVNGRTPGQVGQYAMETLFAPEPGMMCAGFPFLGMNQTVGGLLGAAGCRMPDGSLYEAYTLATFGAGTLTVSVSALDFNPVVIVRDSGGHALSGNSSAVTLPVDRASRYQIVVTTTDQAGTFQLATAFQPDENETCRPARILSDAGADGDNGTIGADSCYTVDPAAGDLTYFSYYPFTVGAAGLAGLSVSSRDFVPVINLLDESGIVLATDSGSAGSGQSELRFQLTPGNYIAQVVSPRPAGGAYTLDYRFTPGDPRPCAAAAANPGDSVAGSLEASSCRTSLGPSDIYSVTTSSTGAFDLYLNASAFDGAIALRDSKDNLLVWDQDTEGLGVTHITADLPPGAYTIVAAAGYGSGSYQLTAGFTAQEIPECTYIQPLDNNGGFIQKLRPGSCRDGDGQPVDYYEFTLPADGVALAVMASGEIDSFLRLTGTAGNVLRSDDNTYGQNAPLIVEYLPAGTYRLAARAASATAGGYYQVDVRTAPGSRPPFCQPRAGLAPNATINATLSYTACQYPGGTFADLYQFTLPSDSTVDLRLGSADFDAYLVLLDARGNVAAEDDDSGGNTDARITRPLPAGSYFVAAKPASGYNHVGGYSLALGVTAP
jgi:hypothetical protein